MANYSKPILMKDENQEIFSFYDYVPKFEDDMEVVENAKLTFVGQVEDYIKFLSTKGVFYKKMDGNKSFLVDSKGEEIPHKIFNGKFLIPRNVWYNEVGLGHRKIIHLDKVARRFSSALAWLILPNQMEEQSKLEINSLTQLINNINLLGEIRIDEDEIIFISKSIISYWENYDLNTIKKL